MAPRYALTGRWRVTIHQAVARQSRFTTDGPDGHRSALPQRACARCACVVSILVGCVEFSLDSLRLSQRRNQGANQGANQIEYVPACLYFQTCGQSVSIRNGSVSATAKVGEGVTLVSRKLLKMMRGLLQGNMRGFPGCRSGNARIN